MSKVGNLNRGQLSAIIKRKIETALSSSVLFAASGSGGGGTPAGSDTQIQYNNGGSFGGVASLTYNDSTGHITVIDDKKLYFGTGNDGYIEYDEDGNDTLVLGLPTGGGQILDDKKLYFGDGKDVSLEYDEDGNDTLSIEGDVLIEADHKLYFGSNKDAHI